MMLTAFPGRTQRQLKNKFKRENRTQSALVSLALDASIAADLTAPLVIEAAPVAKPSSPPNLTYGPDAGVFLFDPESWTEKDLKPVCNNVLSSSRRGVPSLGLVSRLVGLTRRY